jgi:hypothetical protein
VNGAKESRIFYQYELPELQLLEAQGHIIVNFALTQESDWRNANEWAHGTNEVPKPLPAIRLGEGATDSGAPPLLSMLLVNT